MVKCPQGFKRPQAVVKAQALATALTTVLATLPSQLQSARHCSLSKETERPRLHCTLCAPSGGGLMQPVVLRQEPTPRFATVLIYLDQTPTDGGHTVNAANMDYPQS